jgi:hypothetical protein
MYKMIIGPSSAQNMSRRTGSKSASYTKLFKNFKYSFDAERRAGVSTRVLQDARRIITELPEMQLVSPQSFAEVNCARHCNSLELFVYGQTSSNIRQHCHGNLPSARYNAGSHQIFRINICCCKAVKFQNTMRGVK